MENSFPSLPVGIVTAIVLLLSLVTALFNNHRNKILAKKKLAEEVQKKLEADLEKDDTTAITDDFDSIARLQ